MTMQKADQKQPQPLAVINPAEMQQLMEENFAVGMTPTFPRIKVPTSGNNLFMVPTAEGANGLANIEGVVLVHHHARGYWNNPNPTNSPPDCASLDGIVGQGKPGGECARCPFNRWGSDVKGGRGKACKEMHRVYFLRPGEAIPFQLTLPPTSIAGWTDYMTKLTQARKSVRGVWTRFTLVEDTSKGGQKFVKVVPLMVKELSDTDLVNMRKLAETLTPVIKRIGVASDEYIQDTEPGTHEAPTATVEVEGLIVDGPHVTEQDGTKMYHFGLQVEGEEGARLCYAYGPMATALEKDYRMVKGSKAHVWGSPVQDDATGLTWIELTTWDVLTMPAQPSTQATASTPTQTVKPAAEKPAVQQASKPAATRKTLPPGQLPF